MQQGSKLYESQQLENVTIRMIMKYEVLYGDNKILRPFFLKHFAFRFYISWGCINYKVLLNPYENLVVKYFRVNFKPPKGDKKIGKSWRISRLTWSYEKYSLKWWRYYTGSSTCRIHPLYEYTAKIYHV